MREIKPSFQKIFTPIAWMGFWFESPPTLRKFWLSDTIFFKYFASKTPTLTNFFVDYSRDGYGYFWTVQNCKYL